MLNISYSNGSLICKYSLVLNTMNITEASFDEVIQYIRTKKTTKEQLSKLTFNGTGDVNVSKTMDLIERDLEKGKITNI